MQDSLLSTNKNGKLLYQVQLHSPLKNKYEHNKDYLAHTGIRFHHTYIFALLVSFGKAP